ncbi:NAD(P)/FAD-dependent oxidoreductase [Companilactobacillus allii]|uniref:Glutathione reductase n=1 Tax=Companilactobacillus allii TaxID=1847728 RepID=A0A1P8Q467_9LACO|nr:NAD(P)/FAD-dependent oxidoreductase [Companilactobacillus allii]APX72644.1 glutathione reductase [Companilactobacillus allii]USQ69747.1 NAD(P)/FAD-dependent oxidoreductase [Companilactobacillus allii]
MNEFDAIVIGGGPAGLAEAYDLKAAGKNVAVVENYQWGGTCPNRGCDPKKILLSGVQARDRMVQLKGKGFSGDQVPFVKWSEIEAFKETYTSKIPDGSRDGIINAGITAIEGSPKFISDYQIDVDGKIYQADNFIIATGQRPSKLNIEGNENILTSTDFMNLKSMPKKITFIGAGYIAFELATIASSTGAEVHIVHHNDRPLKEFDESFVDDLVDQLKNRGIKFHFDIDTKSIAKFDDQYVLNADDFSLVSDLVVGATGRIPNVDKLDLEKAGVKYTRHGISTNGKLQTTNPRIYAIGDVVDKVQPKLTPIAGFDATYVASVITGKNDKEIVYPAIPTLVYGGPELAKVGISTDEAKKDPDNYRIVDQDLTKWFTYYRTNESIARAKVIFNKNDEIVGATVMSNEADEVINYLTLAINKKMKHNEISNTVFAYPTPASDLQYLI